jgi:hypothetical protein
MIRAQLHDGTFLRLAPKGLDLMLKYGQIKRFLRSSGWVEVGRDLIRGAGSPLAYSGPERRCTI